MLLLLKLRSTLETDAFVILNLVHYNFNSEKYALIFPATTETKRLSLSVVKILSLWYVLDYKYFKY